MQIWMSGEVDADVADAYREVRKDLEKSLNYIFKSKDYGRGLVKWYFIAMILGGNRPDFKEIKRYKANDQTVEVRLIIDHGAFKAADLKSRATQLIEALLRSLSLMEEMRIPDVDVGSIRADLLATAERQRWLA